MGGGFDFKRKGDDSQLLGGHPDDTKTPKSIEMEVNHFDVEFIWRPDMRPTAAPTTAPANTATAAVTPAKAGAPAASPAKK
jgi:hypothetical protein